MIDKRLFHVFLHLFMETLFLPGYFHFPYKTPIHHHVIQNEKSGLLNKFHKNMIGMTDSLGTMI